MDTSTEISSNFSLESSSPSIPSDSSDYSDYNASYQGSHLGFNWNPFDDSDVGETSFEIDMDYEIEKQQEIEDNITEQEEITKARETIAKRYFDINKNKMKSIFNLKGIQFTHFNHQYIKFIFTPSAFSKKYICKHRKFYVSLRYKKKWWDLKRFQVPNKMEVLEFFAETFIDDKKVMKVINKIYSSLVNFTRQQIEIRKMKQKDYLSGKEVELYSDDEKLLLTPDEREKRREIINNIWNRMLPPPPPITE